MQPLVSAPMGSLRVVRSDKKVVSARLELEKGTMRGLGWGAEMQRYLGQVVSQS